MPRNGSGTYAKPTGSTASAGTQMSSQTFNDLLDDIAIALTGSLPRDGSAPMLAALALGSSKIVGLSSGENDTDIATMAEVNAISNGVIPQGTTMLFQQSSAPTGWTKGASHNNKALRVVSGTASSGGSTPFTSVFTSRTISLANMAQHTHGAGSISFSDSVSFNRIEWVYDYSEDKSTYDGDGGSTMCQDTGSDSDNITGSVSGTLSGSTGSTGSGTAMDFAVQYVDVIMASKD